MVIIKYNNSNLGKRYIRIRYENWEYIESCPYDNLADIKLKGFILWTLQDDRTNKRKNKTTIKTS